MTYGAAWVAVKDKEEFEKHGYMDSKQLKLADRERLFSKIRGTPSIHWKVTNLTASDISIWMQSRKDPRHISTECLRTGLRST